MRAAPERFLATVQVGITVIGATAAAFGGATLAGALAEWLRGAGLGPELAHDLALAAIIALISYLSLVLGELVPKSLALRAAERYALTAARPLRTLSWLARPLVWLLTASSNAILRFFDDRTTFTEARLSKEELQQLVEEATTVGSLDRRSGKIAYRALEFGDVKVGAVMVPRPEMVMLDANAGANEIRELFLTRGHARIPVYDGTQDNVIGYATARDLALLLARDEARKVRDVVRPALFAPETALAADMLAEMQQTRHQLLLVVDEQGVVGGLVTLEDLVEELVGEIFAEHEAPVDRYRRMPDGTVVVRGTVPVHEVNRELGIDLPEARSWTTIGGLATSLAGAFPPVGTKLHVTPTITLEVIEASERRVLAVRLSFVNTSEGPPA